MLTYAITIFLSAVLVFQIQPIIAKAILPWFGGGAAVWTACMLFFQILLLLGYLYAHWLTTRFRPKSQILIHTVIVAASLLLLPVAPDPRWRLAASEYPVLNILAVLAISVGVPYFVLSTTTPLVQAWFAVVHRTFLPSRLFSVSNAASLVGLVAYPFALEPLVSTNGQMKAWSIAYGLFGCFCIAVALRSRASLPSHEEAIRSSRTSSAPLGEFCRWTALAGCASALLLSFTNFLSQDVAPVPFLWIVPLACYLLTFIVCFGSDTRYRPRVFRIAAPIAFVTLAALVILRLGGAAAIVTGALVTLLIACMFCHGELARLKPSPVHLTSFYLAISVGGALGGLFVAIVAPMLYTGYTELPVTAAACILLALSLMYGGTAAHSMLAVGAAAIIALLFAYLPDADKGSRLTGRNFYGTLRVAEAETKNGRVRELLHGSTLHGAAFLAPERKFETTTYYSRESGIGVLLGRKQAGPRKVGVVGLGAGTLAAYATAGDVYRFYEINPLVRHIALTQFDFLPGCRGKCEVVMGDARLSLEQEDSHNFDILVLDAFSSDSIPVHLLTAEAFRTYFRHLRPDGVLAVHISNRYLDLTPVVASACEPLGKAVRIITSEKDDHRYTTQAVWAIVTSDRTLVASSDLQKALPADRHVRPWTTTTAISSRSLDSEDDRHVYEPGRAPRQIYHNRRKRSALKKDGPPGNSAAPTETSS